MSILTIISIYRFKTQLHRFSTRPHRRRRRPHRSTHRPRRISLREQDRPFRVQATSALPLRTWILTIPSTLRFKIRSLRCRHCLHCRGHQVYRSMHRPSRYISQFRTRSLCIESNSAFFHFCLSFRVHTMPLTQLSLASSLQASQVMQTPRLMRFRNS